MKFPAKGLPARYLAFLSSLFVSKLGDSLYALAIPWISYQLTGSAVVMGSVYAVSVLPVVLFGSVAGVLVDRMDRRRMMLLADMVRAVLVALIPFLQLCGVLQVWHLYAISFALAVFSILFDVTAVTVIPGLAEGKLLQANASYLTVQQAAELAGPLLAGLLISVIGGYRTLWLDAASFGFTIVTVWGLRTEGGKKLARTAILADMREGFRFLIRSRLNLALSLQASMGNFGFSAAYAVLLFFMMSELHLHAGQVSVNYSLIGAGGMLGSLAAPALARKYPGGVLIPILLGIGAAGFMLPVFVRHWLAPGVAFAIVTVCNTIWNTLAQTLRQETVPSHMLGRVLGFSRVFTRMAMPLGAMAGGLLSDGANPSAVFILAAAAKGVEVLIAQFSPIRNLGLEKERRGEFL